MKADIRVNEDEKDNYEIYSQVKCKCGSTNLKTEYNDIDYFTSCKCLDYGHSFTYEIRTN